MIAINELRFNNWVLDGFGNPVQILDIISEGNTSGYKLATLSPIPLSPEILEKAGFRYDGYVWDTDKVVFGDYKDGVHYCNGFSIGNKGIKIEFVHQLQNLYFALTGQELTINLK